MAPSNERVLPEGFNPLLAPEHMPLHDILVERRRLGQTDLSSKPGYSSQSKEPAGIFDYAHLRVPLPKDLRGSGIFTLQKNNTFPESYFLMRRSKDGFISATGMFKAAFPWSSNEQEAAERSYHKQLPNAGPEEVAGNVWISPADALQLAEGYQMVPWIHALLDPEPITIAQKGGSKSDIHPPPVYKFEADADTLLPPPSTRKRELRSSSPVKSSARKMATPRKPRASKAKQASVDPESAPNSSAGPKENGTTKDTEEGTADKSATPASAKKQDKVIVTVDQGEEDGEVHTKVKVEMPANSPDLPLPQDAEEMIRVAKEMVEKATGEAGGARTSSKRKVDDLENDPEEEIEASDELASGPLAKRQKVQLLETLKKERVRSRTALGLVATLVVGAALSSFL